MSWISFKNVRSDDLNMLIQKMPDTGYATKRYTQREIPGRGIMFLDDDVYEPVKLSVLLNCYGAENTRLFAIHEWLNGTGNLILSDDPDHCYRAFVANTPIVSRFRANDATVYDAIRVTFTCEPFMYEAVPDVIPLPGATTIGGAGTVDAEPEIVVDGTGDCTLTVGSTVLTLTGLTGSITIDCARKIAYSGGTSLSHLVEGEWPKLSTEGTAISWTGSVTSVIVTPNWRWL